MSRTAERFGLQSWRAYEREVQERMMIVSEPVSAPKTVGAQWKTMKEIRQQYDQEWILLGNPRKSSTFKTEAGELLWHSSERAEIWRKAKEIAGLRDFAVLWIGHWPDDGEKFCL